VHHAADALERDLGFDLGEIVRVGPGLHLHHVAVVRCGHGRSDR
jgi:hypothetical protein